MLSRIEKKLGADNAVRMCIVSLKVKVSCEGIITIMVFSLLWYTAMV